MTGRVHKTRPVGKDPVVLMKLLRFLRILSVFAAAALLSAPAGGQIPRSKFAPAVAFNPGPVPFSLAVADLRRSGNLDLVVANFCQTVDQHGNCTIGEGGVSVLLGNGDGTFQPAVMYGTGADSAWSVAVGDVNGDGIPDVVVANWCGLAAGDCYLQSGAVSVLLGNGDGTFQPPVVYGSGGYDAYSVVLADLTGNGRMDIAVTNTYCDRTFFDGGVSVLLNNGDGTFDPAVSYDSGSRIAPSVAIGDVNRDGFPDLVVADYMDDWFDTGEGAIAVLLGNGDGTFQPAVIYDSGGRFAYSIALGDLRGKGILDAVVANRWSNDPEQTRLRGEVSVLPGMGNGTFQPAVAYLASGMDYAGYPAIGPGINSVAVADVNGDGIPDAAVVEWCQLIVHYTDCVGERELNVLLGNGDGTFRKASVYNSGGFIGSALAVADVNNDGRPDLIVANEDASDQDFRAGSVAVLLNETYYGSKTALASSLNPSHVSQSVTFTATITPAVPNGETVTFYAGATPLGTGTTTNGIATLTASFSKTGKYTIKARYPGDAFRKPSSGTVKQVVNP